MFAKDKISVDLRVENTDVYAGESISGTLAVSVTDSVECTAIRVKISGCVETVVEKRESNGKDTHTVTYRETVSETTHVITCLGFTKDTGRKGGCYLTPGANYSYTFNYTIPPTATGTIDCDQGSAKLFSTWVVKGYVDIPHGFDKEMLVPLFVRTPAASAQIWGRTMQPVRIGQEVASCGCTGCYCCATGEHVTVTATVTPPVVLTHCDTYTNGQPAGVLSLSLEVVNESSTVTLGEARVRIGQYLSTRARGRSENQMCYIGSTLLPRPPGRGEVGQEEFAVYAASLVLDQKRMAPSVSGEGYAISHVICVDFPHSKVKEGVIANAFVVANGEDVLNCVPPLPRVNVCGQSTTEEAL